MKNLFALLLLAALFAVLPAALAQAALPDPARFSAALETGDLAAARRWLDEGLDPDFEGDLIGTGLMIGAWTGNLSMMTLFLERGARLDKANRFGETALMLAAWKNQQAALRWLIERGAKPDRPPREWTALHYAVFAGHAGPAEDLLAAGADVNARSTNGSTVVMMAAREGHAALARRLIEAGANPALKNDYGDDAVGWAMRQGNFGIAKLFTDAGNFAELARAAAAKPLPRPQRSLPAPDAVDELLRKARLAEMSGQRDAALAIYRKAWAELKARQAPRKVGAGAAAPQALVIRARRAEPEKQSLSFAYALGESGKNAASVDDLLAQARAAEAAGRRPEALRLFRQVAERIKAGRE